MSKFGVLYQGTNSLVPNRGLSKRGLQALSGKNISTFWDSTLDVLS